MISHSHPCPALSLFVLPRAHPDFTKSASTLFGTSLRDTWPHDDLLLVVRSGPPNFGTHKPASGAVTARWAVSPTSDC
jgi:hypothetical protein